MNIVKALKDAQCHHQERIVGSILDANKAFHQRLEIDRNNVSSSETTSPHRKQTGVYMRGGSHQNHDLYGQVGVSSREEIDVCPERDRETEIRLESFKEGFVSSSVVN